MDERAAGVFGTRTGVAGAGVGLAGSRRRGVVDLEHKIYAQVGISIRYPLDDDDEDEDEVAEEVSIDSRAFCKRGPSTMGSL